MSGVGTPDQTGVPAGDLGPVVCCPNGQRKLAGEVIVGERVAAGLRRRWASCVRPRQEGDPQLPGIEHGRPKQLCADLQA